MIEATLKKCGGDRAQTANMLGTTVRTIYRREASGAETAELLLRGLADRRSALRRPG